MPSENAFLQINVLDDAGNERVPGANDLIHVNGSPVAYTAGQGFLHALSAGEVKLEVKYKGFAVLTQHFSVQGSASTVQCSPYWPGTDAKPGDLTKKRAGYLLECMKLAPATGAGAEVRTSCGSAFIPRGSTSR